MNYNSTRNNDISVSSAYAIAKGISEEGGLFVPKSFPLISTDDIKALVEMNYKKRAEFVFSKYLTDFTADEIEMCVSKAYADGKFDDNIPAPISKLNDYTYMLELWHGPTCAFKDMALQILPHFLSVSSKKVLDGKEVAILVATSGDTGKAALDGFKNAENTKILVFYPQNGVSNIQKLQMQTQEGDNVSVCAIEGNFDDAQSGVKKIFTDNEIIEKLAENNIVFSSANSINWGRLLPQIVYYISAYCDMVRDEEIVVGDNVNIVVPTGNFGNILAAYYAKQMGLPFAKFICASNINNVLTDFIKTGEYDKNRQFTATISPSMDILISSNLERLLYLLSGNDDKCIADLMSKLNKNGKYQISDDMKQKLQSEFYGGCCNDADTKATIKKIFEEYSYVCDTHTAVAVNVLEQYVNETKDTTKAILASTASPFKFSDNVYGAISDDADKFTDFELLHKLAEVTKLKVPTQIAELCEKPVRFKNCCDKADMKNVVYDMLNIK
ncbi:MAG: threonine synthase [Oscillospiraceae bacterium]|nr:threonine synthase [Oscillospiraceae bacterium]